MQWKLYGAVAGLVMLGITALVVVLPASHPPFKTEVLTVADAPQILSTLLYIALAEHYFANEGLEVIVQSSTSGKAALAAVIEQQADVATVAEVPFMWAVLEGRPVQVFATIQATDKDLAITARMDAGIAAPRDLAGKHIGTLLGTASEYFLDLFLTIYGLKASGVVIVPCEPTEVVVALATGRVDAVSVWTALRLQAQTKLPAGTISFFRDGLYTEVWVLAARKEFLQRRPDTTRKLLRALLKAERFATLNRQQAVDIVARRLDLNREKVAELWDNFGFTVSLDQALLVNLESQVRMLTSVKPPVETPDFLHHLSLDGLAAVAPHRVTVLH